jgi:hypothetical protein
MFTRRHYTGFLVKEAIATATCVTMLLTVLTGCNDSSNLQTTNSPLPSPTSSPVVNEGFSLNSILNSIEGAKSDVKEAVGPHADAVQAKTKEEMDKLFRWEYKVVDLAANQDANEFQGQLSLLGDDRWECFSINAVVDRTRVTCRRRPKSALSYLKYIPGL